MNKAPRNKTASMLDRTHKGGVDLHRRSCVRFKHNRARLEGEANGERHPQGECENLRAGFSKPDLIPMESKQGRMKKVILLAICLHVGPGSLLAGWSSDAKAQYDLKNYDAVIKICTDQLSLNPTNEDAYRMRAASHWKKKEFKEAEPDLNEWIRLCRNTNLLSMAYLLRSSVHKEMGQNEAELQDLYKAVEANPKNAFVYLGIALHQLKDYKTAAALEILDRGVGHCPSDYELLELRGRIKYGLGDYAAALADLDRAIVIQPSGSTAYVTRSRVKFELEDYEGTVHDANKAILLDPQLSSALYLRGKAESHLGRFNEAIESLTQAINLEPHSGEAYHQRGHARAESGDLKGGLADMDHGFTLQPDEIAWRYCRGVVAYNLRAYDLATSDFVKATNALESQSHLWLIQSKQGKGEQATTALKAFLSKAEIPAKQQWSLNILRYLAGELTAEELLAAAQNEKPERVLGSQCSAYFYIGMKHLLAGDKAAARNFFEKCLSTRKTAYDEFGSAKIELAELGGSAPPTNEPGPSSRRLESEPGADLKAGEDYLKETQYLMRKP